MNLHLSTENQNGGRPSSASSRTSRMLLAGIQAEFGLDPRLKNSGDDLGERISSPQPQFSKEPKRSFTLKRLIRDQNKQVYDGCRGEKL
jgi:hypothetical protein